jgi:hypothetical protein
VARARWLPLSGIVFVVLGLLAVVAFGGSTPDTDASAAKVASVYDAHMCRQAIAAFCWRRRRPSWCSSGFSCRRHSRPRNGLRFGSASLLLVPRLPPPRSSSVPSRISPSPTRPIMESPGMQSAPSTSLTPMGGWRLTADWA